MTIAFGGAYFRAIAFAGILILGLSAEAGTAAAQGYSGPPGGGGAGQMSSDQRRAIIQGLSAEEKQKFFAMSPDEKKKFFSARAKKPGGQGASRGGGPGGPPSQGGRRRGRPPPLVELAKVERAPLMQIFPITGRLVPREKGAVSARIEGRVAKVLVQVGERVKKGQVLAELSTDRLKLEVQLRYAEVNQARAKLKSARAQVVLLNQEVKRLAGLRRSAAFSQARYEDKRQEVVKASATVEENAAALARAKARHDLARIDLRDAAIRAPFPGAVIIRHVSAGAYIKLATPVVTLLDDQTLEIEADVPSNRLGGLKPGSIIDVRLDDGRAIKARVRAQIPDENPLARTRAVRLTPDINGRMLNLVANQSVVIQVPLDEKRKVIAVNKDAIVDRQNKKLVFVFQNGSVSPREVTIGKGFAGKFEILSGLRPGQQVVVTGNELLRPGQRVRVKRSGGAQASSGGGRGGGGGGSIIGSLSPEERQKFFAMSPEEKRAFITKRRSGGN